MSHHHHRPPHHHPPHRPPHHHPPHHPPHHHDRYAIIRNQKTGVVLDASKKHVKVQNYTGSPEQLWKLEPAGPGLYFIVNKSNGKVLDIENGPKNGNHLITFDKHGGENQQWFINGDGTIVSAAEGELAVDVYKGHCKPGDTVQAFKKHGEVNQQFLFHYE